MARSFFVWQWWVARGEPSVPPLLSHSGTLGYFRSLTIKISLALPAATAL
jgi:hypothetical protein